MNLVLFATGEIDRPLPRSDPRAQHILTVLRRKVGDSLDVGLLNGPRGKAVVVAIAAETLVLAFQWAAPHAPPPRTELILGFARPQTARDILRDATTLGASSLHFVATTRSDPNYAASSLWHTEEWRRHVVAGAAQAFATHQPVVQCGGTLSAALDAIADPSARVLVLDLHDAPNPLARLELSDPNQPLVLLLGPERGWDDADRARFDSRPCERWHLGDRVLRTETAVVAGLTLLAAARARADA